VLHHAATDDARRASRGADDVLRSGIALTQHVARTVAGLRKLWVAGINPVRCLTRRRADDRKGAMTATRSTRWQENGNDNSMEVQLVAVCRELPEALGERDRPGPWCRDATRACTATLPGADRADDEAADPACPGWIAGEAQAQRLGYGQHPLAVRRGRQDVIYENPRDPLINEALRKACERINRRELRRNNRKLRFVVETSPTKRDRFD
jgi:hypothetical protein